MELLELIVLDYRKSAKDCTRRLEFEEAGNTLASLQGELAGCKLFFETFGKEYSSSTKYRFIGSNDDDQKMPDLSKVTDSVISTLESQRIYLEQDPSWEELLQKFDHQIEIKKEWLYSSAEKGRDLIHTHGWRDCLKKHEVLCNSIEQEYEQRKEDNQLFTDDLKLNMEIMEG